MSPNGTSQPWQLPRRTAGHGSKADAGAQPLADSQSASKRIAELEQEIERPAAHRGVPLSSPPARHASADVHHGSCWVSRL